MEKSTSLLPKKPKKVGRTSSPVKRKASKVSLSSDEESFEQTKPSTKTRRKSPAKKVLMKDQSCQTSPAFVKAAKKRKTAAKASKASANPEMEDFEKLAINSAKMATSKRATKSPTAKPKKALDDGDDNPTPAMSALKAKKATCKTTKRTTKSPPAKPKKALDESQGVDNPTPAMLALMAKTKKK